MPGFDQTGPFGKGSMTGHRMGRCTNFDVKLNEQNTPPSANQNEQQPENFRGRGFGRGRGWGGGRGMGRQNRFRGGF